MSDEEFSISLRIWHPSAPANFVVDTVGLNPEIAQGVATPRVNPLGQQLEGTYKNTYCSFLLIRKLPGVFTDSLSKVLAEVEPLKYFFQSVSHEGGRSELFVGIFTEASNGFTIDASSISKMASLSLELSVEIYY